MYFRVLHDPASTTVSYLLADRDAGAAVLVDPRGPDVPLLAAMLDEHRLQLRWMLHTHRHGKLPAADELALDSLQAPRIAHSADAPQHEQSLVFGHEVVQVLCTPGHTEHCLSFLWRDRLFCGGLLGVDVCPWQPRPQRPEALWHSVTHKVFVLPAETLLFCGHSRDARIVSNVLEQRRSHPWFGGAGRDDFLARVRAGSPTHLSSPESLAS